jgi:hypothetical protein
MAKAELWFPLNCRLTLWATCLQLLARRGELFIQPVEHRPPGDLLCVFLTVVILNWSARSVLLHREQLTFFQLVFAGSPRPLTETGR